MKGFDVDEIFKRYHAMLEEEPDFFLQPDCNIYMFADRMRLNRSYASRFVNQHLKTSFPQLVRACKLNKVEELMRAYPEKNLRELICEAGFNCELTFRRAYMEKYGELPSVTRNRMNMQEKKG